MGRTRGQGGERAAKGDCQSHCAAGRATKPGARRLARADRAPQLTLIVRGSHPGTVASPHETAMSAG